MALDTDAVDAWLKRHWVGRRVCPICGASRWTGGRMVGQIGELQQGGGIIIGGQIYPVLPVVCLNCGYTALFNAVVMGLVPPHTAGGEAKPLPSGSLDEGES